MPAPPLDCRYSPAPRKCCAASRAALTGKLAYLGKTPQTAGHSTPASPPTPATVAAESPALHTGSMDKLPDNRRSQKFDLQFSISNPPVSNLSIRWSDKKCTAAHRAGTARQSRRLGTRRCNAGNFHNVHSPVRRTVCRASSKLRREKSSCRIDG